jgi:predicted anti-sigma-YlaC factor YlaD
MATPDPAQRAGDTDRDATAATLREAFAEGRITQSELEDRLDQVHAARTYGELAPITADLPASAPSLPPSQAAEAKAAKRRRDRRAGWASWLGVSVIVNVIWLATWVAGGDSPGYYWPIWVMGPWGAAMVLATLTQKARGDDS